MVAVVRRQRPVRFLVEQSDVLTRRDLDFGRAAGELVGESTDGILRILGKVVDQRSEETVFFDCGRDGKGLVMGRDLLAVRGNDVEQVAHVLQDLIVGGATAEGAGAQRVDGSSFAGDGEGVGDGVLQRGRCGIIDKIGGRRNKGHSQSLSE